MLAFCASAARCDLLGSRSESSAAFWARSSAVSIKKIPISMVYHSQHPSRYVCSHIPKSEYQWMESLPHLQGDSFSTTCCLPFWGEVGVQFVYVFFLPLFGEWGCEVDLSRSSSERRLFSPIHQALGSSVRRSPSVGSSGEADEAFSRWVEHRRRLKLI